jgi:uncharacterized protein YkwD
VGSHRSHARHSSFHVGARPRRPGGHGCPRHHYRRHHSAGRRHHAGAHGHVRRRAGTAPQRSAPAAANSSGCTDAELRPTADNLDRVRAATLCLINRERTGHGEAPLAASQKLERAAQAHSDDMAARDYFEHEGPRGDTPLSRMRECGYLSSSHAGFEAGENIGWGTLWLATPRAMVAAWMASDGHRANILDSHFRDTAIGVSPHPLASLARGQAGAIYTQDFGQIIAG